MKSDGRADAKNFVIDYLSENNAALAALSDAIFSYGELGMQETESAATLVGNLRLHGFDVDTGISGMPTAFLATYGSGQPVIAIHSEYDANPGNSQRAGVAHREEIVPGAPGHCEGHNVNAAVMTAAAIACKYAMQRHHLSGTLKVFGAPGEEQLISRPFFVRDGFFDDVDVALHSHIHWEFQTEFGLVQTSVVSAEFVFHGESAHAAMAPWNGRDALDAVVLMDSGMAQFREHMQPGTTAHRVITDGGAQPNVIPARAAIWWYFRSAEAEGARRLYEQACKVAEGAALMTNCRLEVVMRAAVWPVRCNQLLAETIQRNIERIGMPKWTDAEHTFARAVQEAAGKKAIGLPREVRPLQHMTRPIAASNDCGDISWKVPMARVNFPANLPNIMFHEWAAGAALATSIAHRGGLAGAMALAGTVVDLLCEPGLVDSVKRSFAMEIGEVRYRPLIDSDLRPPVDLNRALMDKYREAMKPYYRPPQVGFAVPKGVPP